jgi:hypothetical protein
MTSEEIDNLLDLMGMYYSYARYGDSGIIYAKDPTTVDNIIQAVIHGPNTAETKLAAYMQLINQGETDGV